MTPILVFDIETITDIESIRLLNSLPETLSDKEVAEFAAQQRRAKTGNDFMPHHLQKIVAISCCLRWNHQNQERVHVATLGSPESSEVEIVAEFFRLIDKYIPQLVSWNGSGFDLPVLHYRALMYGIQAQQYWEMGEGNLLNSRDFKYNNYLNRYHMRHCDLMDLLAMYTGRANAPLDEISKMCGFVGKMGMDGSQVFGAYCEGKIGEIRDYCETDVVNTYLVYQRFRLMSGQQSHEEYDREIALMRQYLTNLATDKPHWREFVDAWR